MRQTDFTRCGSGTPSHQAGFTDGVVGRTELAQHHQRLVSRETPHRTVDPRRFQTLFLGQTRQDCADPRSEQCLAGPGRTDHQQMVTKSPMTDIMYYKSIF